MSDPPWDEIKTWFARALDIPSERRATWFAQQPITQDVRARVASLLSAHEKAGTFLAIEDDARAASYTVRGPEGSDAIEGQTIGPYRVLREIGRGGMGVVYLGERADGLFEKQVAIKVVGGPVQDAAIRQRFESERRVLAALEHPNIAQLLDGGTTPTGVPYLVMELVDGVPIDAHCTARALSTAERLRLFSDVCVAVQYAHQHLIVHRDLKPSNVLVTPQGAVKLLDFGIAKVLHAGDVADATGQGPLTPQYASPEQVAGGTVTTASDVYSLGVILYRLLTDKSPYPPAADTPAMLARAIAEHDIALPSAAGRREVRGDLDAIVLRALHKDPRRRYESVQALLDDLQRYLSGWPVSARRDSWSYRSLKFVRRHRAGVSAAALVVVAVAGGVATTLRQARIADEQRQRAERRFNDVRQLSDSLIFDIHDAIQNLPGATTARHLLLDRSVQYLDNVARDADGDADLQRELAWGYQRLAVVQGSPTESNVGDTTAAIASVQKAAALFEAVARANPGNPTDRLNEAMGHRLLSYYWLEEPRGREALDRAMAITDALMQQTPAPQVFSERSIEFQNLGLAHHAAGDRAAAARAYEQHLALLHELQARAPEYPRLNARLGMAYVNTGEAAMRIGQRRRALELNQAGVDAYAAAEKAAPSLQQQREMAVSLIRGADIRVADGDIDGAQERLAHAARLLTPLADGDPASQMLQLDVTSLDYLGGRLEVIAGRPAQGLARLQRAATALARLKASQQGWSVIPDREIFVHIWTAEAESALGRPEHARDALARAIETIGQAPTMNDDTRCTLAMCWTAMGRLLAAAGRRDEALSALDNAISGVDAGLAEERQNLPAVYPAAEAYLARALVLAKASPGVAPDCAEARAALDRARALLRRIGTPATISPLGLPVHLAADPTPVAACR